MQTFRRVPSVSGSGFMKEGLMQNDTDLDSAEDKTTTGVNFRKVIGDGIWHLKECFVGKTLE